jgi:hypothetical protein
MNTSLGVRPLNSEAISGLFPPPAMAMGGHGKRFVVASHHTSEGNHFRPPCLLADATGKRFMAASGAPAVLSLIALVNRQ